ncbi:MAG: NAD-dependent succinate-semialdehyde dehydrogenase [Rhabdochlamydiaceae bacterium]|nr:NAD-dependent succinate-semialdehyde dehydrogenase [Candidatus Amphrikana amoebophyrae]
MKNISESPFFYNELFINGKWVKPKKMYDVFNPFNYEKIGEAPFATKENVEQAISAAHNCFKSYRKSTPQYRSQLLKNWSKLCLEHKDELAKMITLEQGKTLEDAKGEIDYGLSFVDWFADEAKRIYGHNIQSDRPDQIIDVILEPVGVVGAITPWNFPFAMVTRKIAPALAVGCTVVLKASEETPYIAYALAHLAKQAGFDDGAINIVTGDPAEIGQILCSDVRVRKISFTGSTRVGKILAAQSAEHIQKLSLELGGNAPFIVFESADMEEALKGALYLKQRNGSQSCVCGNRFFIHDSIYDQFVEEFSNRFSKQKSGNGFDCDSDYGPLINQTARDRVLGLIESSVKEGAKIVCGGKASYNSCIEPTVLSEVQSDMTIAKEEIFGPVAPFYRFKTEEEVVEMANDTPYGLASYFYSKDFSQVMRVKNELKSGMMGINETVIAKPQIPFGGVKESGIGKEGSFYGIHDYLDVKCTITKYEL